MPAIHSKDVQHHPLYREGRRGFSSIAEYCDFMPVLLERLLEAPELAVKTPDGAARTISVLHNLVRLFARGINVSTSYSGLGVPEIVFSALHSALKQLHPQFVADGHLEAAEYIGALLVEACELKPQARDVLRSHATPSGHVFENIMHKLNKRCVKLIDDICKNVDMPKAKNKDVTHEEAAQVYSDLKDFLMEVEPRLFRKGRRAQCHMHNQKCLLWEQGGGAMEIVVAGATCKDFSRLNKWRKGHHGQSGRVFLVFLLEQKVRRPQCVFLECTPDQDLSIVYEILGELYNIETTAHCTSECGIATHRRRRLTIMVLKPSGGGRYIFMGTLIGFKALFAADIPEGVGAEMFLVAGDALVAREQSELAVVWQTTQRASWREMLDGSRHMRLSIFIEEFLTKEYGYEIEDVRKLSTAELQKLVRLHLGQVDRFCDLDTAPNWSGTPVDYMPCATTHNVFYAINADRVVMTDEQLLSHGISLFEHVPTPSGPAFDPVVWEAIPIAKRKDMVGDSMNSFAMASFFAYVIGHLIPVEECVSQEFACTDCESHASSSAKRHRA